MLEQLTIIPGCTYDEAMLILGEYSGDSELSTFFTEPPRR
jgi:hypothetical protein